MILITGKHGFIGKRLSMGKKFTGRLENYQAVMKATYKMEGIIHLAAVSNKRLCEANPEKCIHSNLLGVYNVLEVALQRKIWVLFISSFAVREKSFYGLTKLMGEELCRVYQRKGLKVKVLRLPIVYGPGDKSDKVVTKIINELKQGIEPTINTSDDFYFAYVDDVARVIENEVEVLKGGIGTQCNLHTLTEGIKECLKGDK